MQPLRCFKIDPEKMHRHIPIISSVGGLTTNISPTQTITKPQQTVGVSESKMALLTVTNCQHIILVRAEGVISQDHVICCPFPPKATSERSEGTQQEGQVDIAGAEKLSVNSITEANCEALKLNKPASVSSVTFLYKPDCLETVILLYKCIQNKRKSGAVHKPAVQDINARGIGWLEQMVLTGS